MNEISNLSSSDIKILIVVLILVVIQGSWIFFDASRRGENKWIWGLFGLLNVPSSLIIYLIITRKFTRQMVCPHCLYSIKKDSLYCSYCGHEISEEDRIVGHKNKKNDDFDD